MIKRNLCKNCGRNPIFSKKLCKYCTKSKPIKKISNKQEERLKKYNKLREQYLVENPVCEICGQASSTEIHHEKGRLGNNLFNYFKAVCRNCHNKEHNI